MSSRPNSLRVMLALVAWFAQLCLPGAHAATMASSNAGALAWCGQGSPALRAKLAELPADIRHILQDGASQTEHVDDCIQLCAASGGLGIVEPLAVTVSLRLAGIEIRPAVSASAPLHSHGAPPPARGPPSYS